MIVRDSIDYASLPAVLLPSAKAHLRVDFSRDDAAIKDLLARSIDQFQRNTEISVFAAGYTWTPVAQEFVDLSCKGFPGSIGARSPLTPIRSFGATVPGDPDPVDVTADYAFVTNSVQGVQIYYLFGEWQDGLTFNVLTGYIDQALMPPGIIDLIMKILAMNYENREMLVPSGQLLLPLWLETQLAGWWLPKA
jgi:hypothetical protein